MPDVGLTWEVTSFNAAMREMERKLEGAATLRRIIDFEVGKILQATLSRTKTATDVSVLTTESIPWRTWDLGRGKKQYYLLNHYPNSIWAEMERRLEESLRRKLAARGLSKRAWLELGIKIQQPIEAPAQVTRAVSPGGHTGEDSVKATRGQNGKGYEITIENDSPLIRYSGGAQAFFAAVVGRRKYFERNVALGVFDDLKKVAARYPGLEVSTPAAA